MRSGPKQPWAHQRSREDIRFGVAFTCFASCLPCIEINRHVCEYVMSLKAVTPTWTPTHGITFRCSKICLNKVDKLVNRWKHWLQIMNVGKLTTSIQYRNQLPNGLVMLELDVEQKRQRLMEIRATQCSLPIASTRLLGAISLQSAVSF